MLISKKAFQFIILTFLVNWIVAGLFFLFGGSLQSTAGLVLAVGYMFVPMMIAIIIYKVVAKEAMRGPLGISFRLNRWFFVAWLLPPVIAIVTLGVSFLIPGVEFSPGMEGMYERFAYNMSPEQMEAIREQQASMPIHPFWLGLMQGLFVGFTINAIPAFGEELGWRGFLQRELGVMGFWKSSLVIGFIWGVWHAPLILAGHNYPEHPVLGLFMMTLWCMLMAPLISYVRLKSKSVIAAAVMHGTLNATAGLAILVVSGGSDLTVGVTGLPGFIVLAVLVASLYFADKSLTREVSFS
ncbi:MAG: CPBP family intramembrane metalloprotease [Candidatus Marinimicrobia bacterium]|nr:CPBP family intramembrane metalloprotease [Candidatus Neomarinimicrobiota bacterium]MDP6592744.1 CPBP family intramembrane metalloprotease [Candidatus Neomarinimicrobiota bacterium]MDP6835806.1 CPBP family intramembrane metalloprotease [Candidatus Neomarinimicrobiota bacterium]MDP6966852.1 CPBP family intramembrane metalloprotease [Candidatus Neomarinimicrobiota bacterium]